MLKRPNFAAGIKTGGTAASDAMETQLFAVRDENRELKQRLRQQDDRAKKLAAKVQKLSEDLGRQKASDGGGLRSSHAEPSAIAGPRRESKEQRDLIDELRSHVEQLSKNNLSLKTKLHFFKTLHEAESRKRTPYDHIPPRVDSSRRPTILPKQSSHNIKVSHMQQPSPDAMVLHAPETSADAERNEDYEEELQQQQQLVSMLRSKLAESDRELSGVKEENSRLTLSFEKLQQQNDIDRLALQHELNDQRKRNADLRGKLDTLDESHRVLAVSHKELVAVTEDLRKSLEVERQRSLDLEHAAQNGAVHKQSEDELLSIIEDLRREKGLVERELQHMLDNQFGKGRDDDYQKEILQLRRQVADLETQIQTHIKEKADLNNSIKELRARLAELMAAKSEVDTNLYNARHEVEQLQDRLRFFSHNGEINLSEVEEALTMVRLKRERGITLDFLIQLDAAAEDKRALQELRVQFSECAQELEKATKLLQIQEQINKDYKIEVAHLKRQIESLQNEYELRLEEDAQLLDMRAQRIALLESRLKSIVYGVAKAGKDEHANHSTNEIQQHHQFRPLESGQTALELHIVAGLFSDEGTRHLARTVPMLQNAHTNIATFVAVDFFEFETEFTGLGLDWTPHYNHTIRFNVFADDYLLAFLQTQRVSLRIFYTTGNDYLWIGTCHVSLKEFIDDQEAKKRRFYADIYAADQKTVLGKLDYTVQMLTPIALAIRAFKERAVALNLLQLGNEPSAPILTSRPNKSLNHLTIAIKAGTFLARGPTRSPPRIYGVFSFGFNTRVLVTPTVSGTYTPIFDFKHTFPLAMTADLDRHLRSGKCEIVFCDEESDVFYGAVSIALDRLSRGEAIHGAFDILSSGDTPCGDITVTLQWGSPYSAEMAPVISLLDSNALDTRQEMMCESSHQPADHASRAEELVLKSTESASKTANRADQHQESDAPSTTSTASAAAVQSPPIGVAEPPSQTPGHDTDAIPMDHVRIAVDRLELRLGEASVDEYLAATKQVFVSFEFVDCPLDELETRSVPLGHSGHLLFSYVKDFPIDAVHHGARRSRLQRMIGNHRTEQAHSDDQGSIVFTLVHEPPEAPATSAAGGSTIDTGERDMECIDLGTAVFDMSQFKTTAVVQQAGTASLASMHLSLTDPSGSLVLGVLYVSVGICARFEPTDGAAAAIAAESGPPTVRE
ncbi:hypothetical protein BC831DRAFT_474756 [Entophlyctis helioformis]|nr:hypothetical protein BC831DRAFT_474756 [Entophlyctis helioformis]